MTNRVALLIRAARLLPDGADADRRALLTWAEELVARDSSPAVAKAMTTMAESEARPGFPIVIFTVFKGRRYEAVMRALDRVDFEGRTYPSVSAAGIAVTNYNVNGWRFWKYMDTSGRESSIDRLRS
jgi:hypothetical protein